MLRVASLPLVDGRYDTLRCPVDIGGWLGPPAQQGIALCGDGIEILPQEGTERSAVNTYSEWQLRGATSEVVYNYYPTYPDVPWPVMASVIVLRRDGARHARHGAGWQGRHVDAM